MDDDTARTILSVTQQLRVHWSDLISQQFGYAIVTVSAIWSYLIATSDILLLVAAAISSIFLGLWRINTHRIDKAIVGLYGDFVYCEAKLKIPEKIGT